MTEVTVYEPDPSISAAPDWLGPRLLEALQRQVDATAQAVEVAVQRTANKALGAAEIGMVRARAELDRMQVQRDRLEQLAPAGPTYGGSWWKPWIYRAVGGVAQGIEMAICWQSLPFVFGVEQATPLGILLALTTVVSTFIMKEPLERLFRAARIARTEVLSSWRRLFLLALERALLLGPILAGTLLMLTRVAFVREVAMQVAGALGTGVEALGADQIEVIRAAVLAITLTMAVNAAALWALASVYSDGPNAERRARSAVRDHAARVAEVDAASVRCEDRFHEARVRHRQAELDADSVGQIAKQQYLASQAVHLALRLERKQPTERVQPAVALAPSPPPALGPYAATRAELNAHRGLRVVG